MKKYLILLFIFFADNAVKLKAQPNLQYNMYVKEKHCQPKFWENNGAYLFVDSKGRKWGTIFESISSFNYQSRFARFNDQWDTVKSRSIGGAEEDWLEFIRELPNGNFLLVGHTNSQEGDIWFGHSYSAREILMLEVDSSFNIIKGKTFGGGNGSEPNDVIISSDGYIYLAGNTIANDYDFACVNYGSLDASAWIAKYDTAFNKIWIKMYVGNGDEGDPTIKEINSNRYMVGYMTSSTSPESDPANAKGSSDLIVRYIDSNGNTLWMKRYGSATDEGAKRSVIDPVTKDIYFIGISWLYPGLGGVGVASGDITYKSGTAWVHRIDTLGNVKASKAYGAYNNSTYIEDARWWNNKLVVKCFTDSKGGGDFEEHNTGNHMEWIALIDSQANLVGKYTIKVDNFYVKGTNFTSFQNNLWVPFTTGGNPNPYKCDTNLHTWVVLNFGEAPLGIENEELKQGKLAIVSPNPGQQALTLRGIEPARYKKLKYRVLDATGKVLARGEFEQFQTIDCNEWTPGQYVIEIKTPIYTQTEKFLKL